MRGARSWRQNRSCCETSSAAWKGVKRGRCRRRRRSAWRGGGASRRRGARAAGTLRPRRCHRRRRRCGRRPCPLPPPPPPPPPGAPRAAAVLQAQCSRAPAGRGPQRRRRRWWTRRRRAWWSLLARWTRTRTWRSWTCVKGGLPCALRARCRSPTYTHTSLPPAQPQLFARAAVRGRGARRRAAAGAGWGGGGGSGGGAGGCCRRHIDGGGPRKGERPARPLSRGAPAPRRRPQRGGAAAAAAARPASLDACDACAAGHLQGAGGELQPPRGAQQALPAEGGGGSNERGAQGGRKVVREGRVGGATC
jgi:hypothetical protein